MALPASRLSGTQASRPLEGGATATRAPLAGRGPSLGRCRARSMAQGVSWLGGQQAARVMVGAVGRAPSSPCDLAEMGGRAGEQLGVSLSHPFGWVRCKGGGGERKLRPRGAEPGPAPPSVAAEWGPIPGLGPAGSQGASGSGPTPALVCAEGPGGWCWADKLSEALSVAASGQTRVWLTGPGPSAPGSPVGAVLRLVTYAGHKCAGPRVGPGVLPRRATHCGGLRRRWWLLQVHPCPERATSSGQNTLALLFSPNFIALRRAWLRSVLSVLMLTPTLAEIRGQDLRPQMPAREDSDGWALGAQHPLATPCSQGVRRPHVSPRVLLGQQEGGHVDRAPRPAPLGPGDSMGWPGSGSRRVTGPPGCASVIRG